MNDDGSRLEENATNGSNPDGMIGCGSGDEAREQTPLTLRTQLAQWAEEIAHLDLDHAPADVPPGRWRQLLADARRLIDDGIVAQAAAAGWAAHDLFGCDAEKTVRPRRSDGAGLVRQRRACSQHLDERRGDRDADGRKTDLQTQGCRPWAGISVGDLLMDGELRSSPYRKRLPNRRMAETRDIGVDNTALTVTVGLDPTGGPKEVFVSGAKSGSGLDFLLGDLAVIAMSVVIAGHPF